MSMDELANVKGRGWDDVDVSGINHRLICSATGILTFTTALNNYNTFEQDDYCRMSVT